MFINGGTIELSSKEDPTQAASFTIGVTKTTPLSSLLSDSGGGFGGGGPITAAIDGQAIVSLPIAGPTAGNALGTLTLGIPDLGKFADDLVSEPGNLPNDVNFGVPDLANLFNSIDLLGNDLDVIGQLENYLQILGTLLSGKLFGLDIPLIGNDLQKAGDFLTPIENAISAMSPANSMAELQTALYDALGPNGGLGVLLPLTGGGGAGVVGQPITTQDAAQDVQIEYMLTNTSTFATFNGTPPNPDDVTDIQVDHNLGGTMQLANIPINGDIGLPGLGLSVNNGSIDITVGWTLALDFGIDRNGAIGAYIATPAGTNELSVNIGATLASGAELVAHLGFLAVTATQPTPGPGRPGQSIADGGGDGGRTWSGRSVLYRWFADDRWRRRGADRIGRWRALCRD